MFSVVRFLLCLLVLCQTGETTDVKTVFMQTGNDVLLEIRDPSAVKDYFFFAWIVDKKDGKPEYLVSWTRNSIRPEVTEKYKETVFPLENYSVTLKNLQKTDSGLYSAQLSTTGPETLVTYNITVEDPVSPVKVTVTSVSSSPDSCNVTVSCTTDDFTISRTMTCTNQTCTNQGNKSETTPSDASLHMYLSNDSVTCNHSNRFNYTTASAHLNLICPDNPVPDPIKPWVIPISIIVLVLVLLIIGGVLYRRRKQRQDKTENVENTVYAIPELTSPDQTSQHQTIRMNDTSVDSLTSTYSLVGPHTGPMVPTAPRGPTETVYAQVNKPSQSK